MTIKKGDKVKVEYVGKLEDGEIFDSSENHGKPLEFEVGAGQLIKGFDEAVVGMNKGDKKEIKIKSEEGYGEPKEDLIQKVPRNDLPKDKELNAGMMLSIQMPNGVQIPAMITEVNDIEVTIDMNHPLAGKTLIFEIKIVEIEAN
ncbi:peptidylprolyl isomerase [Candidatus Woesearchaeota archaeon]|nr:peptidylprolyl isomerase [Candidatus Woesearchaeota archaeon]